MLPALGISDTAASCYSATEAILVPLLAGVARRSAGCLRLGGYNIYTDPGGKLNTKLLDAPLSGRCYLRGYWQSPRYFSDYAREIRKAVSLEPCTPFRAAPNTVCVHVRSYKEDTSTARAHLAREYYETAYRRCNERLTRPIFVVYSDDLGLAKTRGLLPPQYELGQNMHSEKCRHHDLCEMLTMSQFDNFIIANSTFSWWAAYLNKSNPWVQAPGRYRHSWYSKDPLPAEWDEV